MPSGATVWYKKRLEGLYVLEYTATPVSEGGVNNFWNGVDVRSPDDLFATSRGGALAEYDHLNNGRLVFDYRDPEPYTSGHFAFRTVWSHFQISDFRAWRLSPQQP